MQTGHDPESRTMGISMKTIRLLIPALAAALLAGCITTDYGYRDGYGYRNGHGDYYYSRPQGSYYGGVGYGYPGGAYGYGGYRYGSPSGYYGGVYSGYPYRYGYYGGYGYGRYPYSGYPYSGHYTRPPVVIMRPDRNHHHDHDRNDRDRRKAPWRDLDTLRRNNAERPPTGLRMPVPPTQPGTNRVTPAAAPTWRAERPVRQMQSDDRAVRQTPVLRERTGNRPVRMQERELRQRSEP